MIFKYNLFGYDRDGYNREGYNKAGYDRNGFDRAGFDAEGYDRAGFDTDGFDRSGWDRDGYDRKGFGHDGFNREGYDCYGYGRAGFDKDGFDRSGWDRDGYDRKGFGHDGFNREGYDCYGYDRNGFDRAGFDAEGYDRAGYNSAGYNRAGYDRNGFDKDGFDAEGYDKAGFDKLGFNRDGYNAEGFDRTGFDRDGFDRSGWDRDGYDRKGFGHDGFNREGYDCYGYDRKGFDHDGYGRNGADLSGHTKDGRILCPECHFIFPSTRAFCPDCGCPITYIERYYELHEADTNAISSDVIQEPVINTELADGIQMQKSQPDVLNKADSSSGYRSYSGSLRSLVERYDAVVLFDVETTGLDFCSDNMIELAYLKLAVDGGAVQCITERDCLIQLEPGDRQLTPQITAITHISSDMLASGITRKELLAEVVDMLSEKHILLTAYNANFDLNFLKNFLEREGKKHLLDGVDFLDLLTLYKDRRPYPHKLKDAIRAYGCEGEIVNSHRAIDDVRASLRVLEKMADERGDVEKYINLFGYNPKYSINGQAFETVRYVPQPYNSVKRIYEY